MLSNLGTEGMAAEDGPWLEAILDAMGSDRCLSAAPRRPFPFSQNASRVALPLTSIFRDAIESREMSVRGPLTGHLTGRVLRGMFA